jgi:APA family basic amino acid/polyamine antiporter
VPVAALAGAVVVLFTATNWAGTRSTGFGQTAGTVLKGAGLLAMIAVLFALAPGRAAAPEPAGDAAPTFAALAVALRAIQNTYSGWNMPAYFGEELRDPGRNVARAVFGGLAAITVLYVLALVAVAAIANLYPMATSRVAYSMARDGVLPAALARVSASGTPRTALVATGAAALLLATSGTYEQLLAMAAPVTILVDVAVILAALRLRRMEPEPPRPFRMPLFPATPLLALALNAALLVAVVWEDPVYSLLGVGLVAAISTAQRALGRATT